MTPLTPERTGVGNYCYFLLKNLVALGGPCEFRGFSSGRAFVDISDFNGAVSVRRLPAPTRVLYRSWDWFGVPKVDTFLGGVDVYHATNYFLPPTRRARRVVTVHDLAFLVCPEWCSPKIVGPFAKGVKRFCAEADAVLVYSESTKRDIERLLGTDAAKITVAPMAVDESFKPMKKETAKGLLAERYGISGPFLLFVSTLEPRKNVVGLLRAFGRIADRIPHRLLLVGGVGWNAGPIFETIERLDLGHRIIRPGFVPHSELPAFYSAADVFVFPTHYEGFGLPLLEALTCGCAVVTCDNSSVPEVTGEGAIRVPSGDETAFAEAVMRVLEDTGLRERLIAAGLEHARRFSWRACAETTMRVYQRLAS